MFSGLFSRTKVQKWETDLLVNIFAMLPEEYLTFKNQVEEGLFSRVRIGSEVFPNYVGFSYIPVLSRKYEDKKGRFCRLSGINVYDTISESYIAFDVYISSGFVTGYSTPKTPKYKLDIAKINLAGFRKEYLDEDSLKLAKSILNPGEVQLLNPSDFYEIELNGKTYYHIREIGDGDFIGIDGNKNIYEITHDPYEITPIINKTLLEILSES